MTRKTPNSPGAANPPQDRDAEAAAKAMQLVQDRQPEAAARLLHRELGQRMQRYFQYHRVPPDDAEELVTDVWMKFLGSRYDGRTRPVVWMWTIANSVLVDWARARSAQRRGGSGQDRIEIHLDEETLAIVIDQTASIESPGWLKLCIQRAAHQLECDDPNRAHVLWLSYRGYSAAEIALVFGAAPPPTAKQETAARNRVLEAIRKARGYFEHCKEST